MDPLLISFLVKAIDLALFAAEQGPALVARANKQLALVKVMIAEARPPTPIETAALDAETESLSRRLQAVAAADRAAGA